MKPQTQAGGGARRPRSVSDLQWIAACILLDDSNNIQTAKGLGVHSTLLAGFRALHRQHPQILEATLAWPDQEAAEGLVLTYGNYGGRPQKEGRTSRWDLASRLSPEAFVRLYVSASKGLTPVLCTLPDPMLKRAASMNGELKSAFKWLGKNDWRAKPSAFFPSIERMLDPRIIERGLELDVDLLTAVAACPHGGQAEFFDRWVKDSPAVAREWARLPAWQRTLYHRCTATVDLTNPKKNKPCADVEAHEIWDSFKYLRGQFLGYTDVRGLAPRRRQAEHPQTIGTFFQHFAKFTFQDRPRWHAVFWGYGWMLAHAKDGGDMYARAPWEGPR